METKIYQKENNLKRESFDFVVTRAVSGISNIIKLSSPYLNSNGRMIVMRGERGEAELETISKDLKDLEFTVDELDVFSLPFCGARRVNILLRKKS